MRGKSRTYLTQKIHLQEAYWVKTPPRIGPRMPDMEMTSPMTDAIMSLYFRGVTSGNMIMVTENLYQQS